MKKVLAIAVLFALVLGFAPAATATDPVYVAPAGVVNVQSVDTCNGTCAPAAAAAAAVGYGAQPFQLLAVPTYARPSAVQAFNAYGANANAVRVQTVRVQNVQPAAVVRVQNVHVQNVQPAAVVRVQNVQAHAGANAVRVQSAGNSNIKVQVNNGNQRQGLFGRLLNR